MATRIATDKASAAIGLYSQGWYTEDTVYVSGQLGILLTDKESPEEAAEIRSCFYHQKISFFHSPHGKERSAMTSQIHPLKPCPHTFHGHSLPLR